MAVLLARAAAARPAQPALADAAAVRDAGVAADIRVPRDRAELNSRVNQWIHALRESGLRVGDRVALVAGNRADTVEAVLACLHAGLTAVPVNWHLTAAEIAYQLDDSGAKAVIADPAHAEVVSHAISRALREPVALLLGDARPPGWKAAEDLLARLPRDEPADQCCGSVMLYTSGTTGRPKGVQNGLFVTGAPFRRVERLLDFAGRVLGVPDRGAVLLAGPWYHSAQLFFAVLPLLRGARLVIQERFEPAETLAVIEREQIGYCHLVPTQFVRLLRLPAGARARFDGSSLVRVWHGGAACDPETKRAMLEWWGDCLVEYYAATEGGVATLIDAAHWRAKPGSVGRPVAGTEVVIVGADGDPLPAGVEGRVYLRRAADRTFTYHNAPEKTAAAHLAPGVFTYGELGYLDEDGYLFLTGRHQDMIITGGVNVYPAEVEAVLLSHRGVRDAAVLGVADDEYGERVVAVVETDPGQLSPDRAADELDRHCRERLAGFKVPRAYRVTERLPREPTGKLPKHTLRAWFEEIPA